MQLTTMVIFTALPPGTSNDGGRILVDESDYQVDDEPLPFEIKDVVRIRANEKFSKYYDCMDELGEGKFGKVYRCREKATGLELAAKRIKIKRDADREKVEREVAIMTKLRHPRIAQIYDAFAIPDNDVVLVMEIVNGGELFDRVVDENYILTELAVVMIVCQLCEAISYIHSKNIVHLDIKPENIMCVSQTGNRIKLIDFGLAQFYDGSSNLLFMAGTPEFVAPEVIKFEPIDFYTDMWSIGVITYILLSGISPFLGETLGDTYVAVEKGEWEFDDEAFEGISDAAKDFISKLLIMDQKQRMLPDDCLNHPWIVGSRTKAASDLILSQANSGTPLSKEGLIAYIRSKRFRKATWALVFLIRFKRQTLMNFGKRSVSTTDGAIAEVCDGLPVSIGKIAENCAESEANVFVTAEPTYDDKKMKVVLTDTSVFDTSKMESVAATKHPEEKKLSSEIPKKKAKPNTTDEEKKKTKSGDGGRTKKGANKHREKNNEKSDEISCKPKKVSKHLKTLSGGLEGQIKKSTGTASGCNEVNDSKNFIPVMCEVCITLETTKPAASFTEFSKSVYAAESAHFRSLSSGLTQTSKNEAETGRPKKYCASSCGNRTAQESTRSSSNKLSEINKKGSSVAAILSMFTEKAEQERKRFERRPSRPVRTFRDVEKSASRKSSLITLENDGNCVKLYRAPEEEKKRVENLIELHRRGSIDRKQVDTKEIAAVKQDEGSKSFKRLNAVEQDKVELEGMNLIGKKMEANPTLNEKKRAELSVEKVAVSNLASSELGTVTKTGQTVDEQNADIITVAKTAGVQNGMKEQKKDAIKFTINQEAAEGVERPVENAMVEESEIQTVLESRQKREIQNDSIIKRSKKTKNLIKLDESEINFPLNPLNLTPKQPKCVTRNDGKQITTTSEKRALSSEPRLSEEKCVAMEYAKNQSVSNVPEQKKNKVKVVEKNPGVRSAAGNLVVEMKNSEELTEHQDPSSGKKMKEGVRKLKKGTVLMELVAVPGNSQFLDKAEQVTSIDANNSKIKKSVSVLQRSSADLTTTTIKDTEENRADELLQCVTPKKPPKGSGRKKVIKETKVKKPQDKCGSVGESITSDLKNAESIASLQNELPSSTSKEASEALHSVQGTVSSAQRTLDQGSLEVFRICETPTHVKRKVAGKNSCLKNSLVRTRSEISLADNKGKMESASACRKAVDDQAVLGNEREKNQRNVSIADLKKQENYSFGWLKFQLEARVNKENGDQLGWRYRRRLEISPLQSRNAKKALSMWKTMEQSSTIKS
ncbi:unnamed protein product [Litomosoides sigmodontis]|uniref:Protein kinase domain-containing protein n=1 Tax=Litomosoides sigmodontis TaxID=42156 RepID=A0A3P6SW79_LITSI|nr:unnamed protein product [Litomosoides sigmodontis]